MAQLQRLNHRHEAIVNWLVANPHRPLYECAEELGYTQPWLTQIVHSDMLQAKYQERCQEVGAVAVHTVKSRLTEIALMAMEKTHERLMSGASSERFLTDTTKNVLGALGYSAENKVQPQVHQHLHVDAEVLMAARARASQRFDPPSQNTSLPSPNATVVIEENQESVVEAEPSRCSAPGQLIPLSDPFSLIEAEVMG